ncbi:MAG: hypothetical protein GY908_12805 [Flavobacteriales bacterium]|nr:hypothetical protein [Flavobacteriales bacterium]
MNRNKHTLKFLSALGLFIALMLPMIIEFVHVFDTHEHIVCTDQDLHVDQTQTKCDICTTQVPPIDFSVSDDSEILQTKIIILKDDGIPSLKYGSVIFNSNPLRGPPTSILS